MKKWCQLCNKKAFSDYAHAEGNAKHFSNDMVTMHVYPCPHGKGFHTSKYAEPFKTR